MSVVAIIGCGYVGQGMRKIFPNAVLYDPPQGRHDLDGARQRADLAIICVPTPRAADGTCDTSIVEQAISELKSTVRYVLIKSTVRPGTTERLEYLFKRPIAFSPEYMGEGSYWQPTSFPSMTDPVGHGFMTVGGDPFITSAIIDIFLPVLGPNTRYRQVTSREAELIKYFENAFLGLKVTYATLMRAICDEAGVSYHAVREGWLDDPRVGTSHSVSWAGRPGFDGKCLPKDISALNEYAKSLGINSTLLAGMLATK